VSAQVPSLQQDLVLARRVVLEAGRAVLWAFGRQHEVHHKAPDQPVTAADLEAEAILRSGLMAERSAYGWLSEEAVDSPDRLQRDRVWIVDPIDGTRSYIAGRPEYSLSVALVAAGSPIVGIVLNPSTGELFTATRGGGSFMEQLEATRAGLERALDGPAAGGQQMGVGRARHAADAVLVVSRSEKRRGEFAGFGDWHLLERGSTAYKMALVAGGRADAFVSRGPKSEWDVCAGLLLVEEAGGRVTDARGDPIRFNRADPAVAGVAASNGALHEDLLEAALRARRGG
jgi:myo-inositol-1(or 4)-monophosphatase